MLIMLRTVCPRMTPAWRALRVLTRRWPRLQVRSGGGQQSPFLDELLAAQGTAETQGFGLFTKVSSTRWLSKLSDIEMLQLCHIYVHNTFTCHCPCCAGSRGSEDRSKEAGECV